MLDVCRAAPKTAAKRDAIVSKALPMEVAMLADEGAFIGGVALTMTAITLLVSNWAQHSSSTSNAAAQAGPAGKQQQSPQYRVLVLGRCDVFWEAGGMTRGALYGML
jgi:hypothetical protein